MVVVGGGHVAVVVGGAQAEVGEHLERGHGGGVAGGGGRDPRPVDDLRGTRVQRNARHVNSGILKVRKQWHSEST